MKVYIHKQTAELFIGLWVTGNFVACYDYKGRMALKSLSKFEDLGDL